MLLVFGPKRLPEMGRGLGRGMREFKDSISGKDEKPAVVQHSAGPADDSPAPAAAPAQPSDRDTVA